MAITTIDDVKTHLGISGTTEDSRLSHWLPEIEAAVLQYCRPGLLSESVTEYYDGDGLRILTLDRRPVTAITGVWVDQHGFYSHKLDSFPPETEWTIGEQFAPRSLEESERNPSILMALPPGTVWPCGTGNIKVSYTAGYATPPADLVLAVHQLIATVRRSAGQGVGGKVVSESIGKYSYELASPGKDDAVEIGEIRSLLATYKREPW